MINGNFFEGLGWLGAVAASQVAGDKPINHMGFNLWMYNMYDAYRDAGGKPAEKHNVFENYIANYNPLNIIDPIGAPIVGLGVVVNGNDDSGEDMNTGTGIVYYTFVGFGEEALFRGFLFPSLSSWMGKWGGALTSSVLFSLVHDNSGSGDFLFRFLAGMLFCWQLDRNKYDLRKNIFAHSWYDVFVTGTLSIAPRREKIESKNYTVPTLTYQLNF